MDSSSMDRYLGTEERTLFSFPVSPEIPIKSPQQQNIFNPPLRTDSSSTTISSLRRSDTDSTDRTSSSISSVSSEPPWHQHLAPSAMPDDNYELPCEFIFMGCEERYLPREHKAWMQHNLSHLGDAPYPTNAVCLFCDEYKYAQFSQNPRKNWISRMVHIGQHCAEQPQLKPRPDYWLIEHMWEHHLIDEEDYRHAVKYTERPFCDGLVPRSYQTKDMKARTEKNTRINHDLQKEERDRKRGKRERSTYDGGRKLPVQILQK